MEDRQIKQKCSIDLPTQQSITNLQKPLCLSYYLLPQFDGKPKQCVNECEGKCVKYVDKITFRQDLVHEFAWFFQLFLAGRTGKTTMTVIAIDWCREIVWS